MPTNLCYLPTNLYTLVVDLIYIRRPVESPLYLKRNEYTGYYSKLPIPLHKAASANLKSVNQQRGFLAKQTLSNEKSPAIMCTFFDWPIKAIVTVHMHSLLEHHMYIV